MAAPLLPPPEYDHPPAMPVIERVLRFDELQQACRLDRLVLGCSSVVDGRCEVLLIDPSLSFWRGPDWNGPAKLMMQADQDAIRRHELAHCNGWEHQVK